MTWSWILWDASWATRRYFKPKLDLVIPETLTLTPLSFSYRLRWWTLMDKLSLWGQRESWWSEATAWCWDTGTMTRKPIKLSLRAAGTRLGMSTCQLSIGSKRGREAGRVKRFKVHVKMLCVHTLSPYSDTASLSSLGYCRIEGRLKDMIIRGGENIYPAEIEQFLHTHPKIQDVQVKISTTGGQ